MNLHRKVVTKPLFHIVPVRQKILLSRIWQWQSMPDGSKQELLAVESAQQNIISSCELEKICKFTYKIGEKETKNAIVSVMSMIAAKAE